MKNPPPHSKSLRRGRFSEPGRTYLVTTTTASRIPLFLQHDAARSVARICHDPKTWPLSTCVAWVVMPDHWHGLVELGDEPLSRAVARFKGRVSRSLGQAGMWQEGFHDCGLRRDGDLRRAARYLVANPVRAGLVDSVLDYPYWNTVWL
ncbi:REP-associated tyrosine transposase [Luteibacter sp. W1I16]|uniref:REP-associated tyrosine transposase n=1 Tax=Luteibacter sp. W1I16 TaxID=3373922 RepID=UPI003D220331